MFIYLVRHGETDWNLRERIQGCTDIPLNETGRAQARATGQLLARRRWNKIFASPLSRALETAQIIASAVGLDEPEAIPEIVERNYGDAEGCTWPEVEKRYPGDTDVPGRESREAVIERVLPALGRIAEEHPDESIIVVAHGGVIAAVLAEVAPGLQRGRITNGSVHSFRYENGALVLAKFDDPIEIEATH